jgi:hypothetical protein
VAAADANNYTIYRTTLGVKFLLLYLVLPKCPLPKIREAAHLQRSSLTTFEGRDNHCLLHLTNPKECPNAPQTVCHKAQQALIQKGIQQEVPLFGDVNAALSTSNAITGIPDDVSASMASSAVVKKRKLGDNTSLDGFVDHALTPLQQQNADVKLFR